MRLTPEEKAALYRLYERGRYLREYVALLEGVAELEDDGIAEREGDGAVEDPEPLWRSREDIAGDLLSVEALAFQGAVERVLEWLAARE